MKKTYIEPSMAIVEVELENVIATSPTLSNSLGDGVQLSNDRDSDDEEDLW